jgi:hypothetical protein
MKVYAGRRLALGLGAAVAVAFLCAGRAEAQNINLKPTYGAVKLKAGFTPDPHKADVVAGGNIRTKLGGVNAWIANPPDFRLFYTAGRFALTFYVRSRGDTTLLINQPDGTWIADDDSGGNLNPQIRLGRPQSGRYDIYVGTVGRDTVNATLFITELK